MKLKSILVFFTMLSGAGLVHAASAGTFIDGRDFHGNGSDSSPYSLTIVNNTKVKLHKARINTAFYAAYPAFAVADGYDTKLEVKMRVIDTANTFTISARSGEIVVNSSWIEKKKSLKTLQLSFTKALQKNWVSVDTVKKGDYQLIFINKNSIFDPTIQRELTETFFKVFPVLVTTFNDKTTHEVLFVTDTAYQGVAEASGNRILFSTTYMNANPTDIDIVTHEGMHLVQGYAYDSGPVWLTEGIADFVRYKYGVDNIGSNWSLPDFRPEDNEIKYENSYRITARFFEWIDQKFKPGMITQIDEELRNHTYNEDTWVKLSGKTINELWSDYAENPELILKYSGKARM
jgi:hypothetical protein